MSERDAEAMPHRLGEFGFAETLAFIVYGDDARDPMTARVVLDDGVQAPYQILVIEGVGCCYPSPEVDWREGWIDPGDPWARVIYGKTIGVARRARRRGRRSP